MSFVFKQSGSIELGAGDTVKTATLPAVVNQSRSILQCNSYGGASGAPKQNCITVRLGSDGVTVTAERTNSGSVVTVHFCVFESTKFSVQHFEVAYISGTVAQAITSVDTARSWVVPTGARQVGGTTFANNSFAAVEITSSTNANIDALGTGYITFQVVSMDATDVERVQLVKIAQTSTSVNTAITSCAAGRTLLFISARYTSGSSSLTGQKVPAFTQSSATNILASTQAAPGTVSLESYVYVVTFTRMIVAHSVVAGTASLTVSSILNNAPDAGAARINGIYGRFSTDNSTTTDIPNYTWGASLSGKTWTFTRAANTQAANLSYSTWDWAGIFPPDGVVGASVKTAVGRVVNPVII